MAVYPCDWSKHRYAQQQQSVYITRVVANEAETFKLRFCPRHFDEVLTVMREKTTLVDEESLAPEHCELCEDETVVSYYIKLYPLKAEVVQRALEACYTCATAFEHDTHMSNGKHLTPR
jgi:hypothetical protein